MRDAVEAAGHQMVDGFALQARGNDAREHCDDDRRAQKQDVGPLRGKVADQPGEGLPAVFRLLNRGAHIPAAHAAAEALLGYGRSSSTHAAPSSSFSCEATISR